MAKRKQRRSLNTLSRQFRSLVWAFLLVACFIVPVGQALDSVSPEEAIDYVGERAVVCGTVASAHYATGSRGQPTFLNLNRPYPDHVFTAVVWGEDRSKFSYPPESLEGEDICVQGHIESYKGTAQIIVDESSQIVVR